MPSNRTVHVRTADDGVAARTLREGIAKIQAELDVDPEFPAEVEEAAAASAAAPRAARPGPDRPRARHDRPARRARPRPGALPRAGRRRLPRLLRHRRRRGVRHPGRRRRRGGAPPRADALRRRLQDPRCTRPSSPRTPARCCPTRCARRCCGRSTSTPPARAPTSSSSGRWCARAPSSTYERVQRMLDDGNADESLRLLREVGALRQAREAARGGVSLPIPEQEVDVEGDTWDLEYRPLLDVELWNAQISLLTGFAAASLMVYGAVGVLRTLPPPDPRDVAAPAPHGARAAHRLAGRAALPRLHPHPRPGAAGPRRDGRRLHAAAARQRVRRVQRRGARAADARRARLGVRPRHGAAASPRRPLRRRDLRRALRGHRGAAVGPRPARRAARHHARLRSQGVGVRGGGGRPRRDRAARAARGRAVRRRGRRGGREGPAARHADPGRPGRRGAAGELRRRAAARHRGVRRAGHGRPRRHAR